MNAILLDIGNVVMRFDFAPVAAHLAERCPDPKSRAPLEHIAPLKRDLEIGNIDGETFLREASRQLRYRGTTEELRRVWENVNTPHEPMWDTIDRLRDRYRLCLLSDTSDIHRDALFRDHTIFQHFDGGVYSFEMRCRKPDPAMFRAAIEQLKLVPTETLYVDDRAPNVEGGARAGFRSLLYDPEDHDRFLREARALGIDL